jgi:hypothetical protein
MDWMVRLSALSARVDRVLQSEEASTSGGKSSVILEKEEWPENEDTDDYLLALQANPETKMFRIGRSGFAIEWFPETTVPSSWVYSNVVGKLAPFDTSRFSRMYMVFGEGTNCLLFMTSSPLFIVVKAKLQTIERRIRKRVRYVPPVDGPISMRYAILQAENLPFLWKFIKASCVCVRYARGVDVTTSCTVKYFLDTRKTMKLGIAFQTDSCNTYNKLHIDGSSVVLEYGEYDGNVYVGEFVLTYTFRTQSSEG